MSFAQIKAEAFLKGVAIDDVGLNSVSLGCTGMASQLPRELLEEYQKAAAQCASPQSASTKQEHALYEHQHAPKVAEYQYQQQQQQCIKQESGATQRAPCSAYKEDKMTKLVVAVFDQMCLLDPRAQDVSSGPQRVTLEQGDKASCCAAPS